MRERFRNDYPRMPGHLIKGPEPTWEESKAAFAAVREKFAIALKPKIWNRAAFIAHYEKILANPDAKPFAKKHSREALKNLLHEGKDRIPGEDDE